VEEEEVVVQASRQNPIVISNILKWFFFRKKNYSYESKNNSAE
jgi:hypothetical protein